MEPLYSLSYLLITYILFYLYMLLKNYALKKYKTISNYN